MDNYTNTTDIRVYSRQTGYYEEVLTHTPSIKAKTSYFYLLAAGYASTDEKYYFDRQENTYKGYILLYTLGGKGHIKYRGKQYTLTMGKIFLFDSSEEHTYYTDKNELWKLKWINFDGNICDEYYKMMLESFGPILDLKQENDITQLIDLLISLIKSRDIYFELKAFPIIAQILTNIITSGHSLLTEHTDKINENGIMSVIRYIEENYMFNISLSNLAEAACCSKYHLSRIFKSKTGFSPIEYVVKYRINRAKMLLSSTNMSVNEIARNIGFRQVGFFITTFKEIEGVTPLRYRKFWTAHNK